MSPSTFAPTIRFTPADLAVFRDASHDNNPLHMSATYARRTSYAEPIVFGILGALASFGSVPLRDDAEIASATITFRNPLLVGVDYQVEATEQVSGSVRVALRDAGRDMLTAVYRFRARTGAPAALTAEGAALTSTAVRLGPHDLRVGLEIEGTHAVSPKPFLALWNRYGVAGRGIDPLQLATFLWASYVVGMELPGEKATFSRLKIAFAPTQAPPMTSLLGYRVTVQSYDERFDLLELGAAITCAGIPFASAEIWSLVRRDPPATSLTAVAQGLASSDKFRGRVALVVGGSRGLGAAIVVALVSQGCHVFVNYALSREAAEVLKASLSGLAGRITLAQGDATDPGFCRMLRDEIRASHGGLDVLVANASPPIRPLDFDLDAATRGRSFVSESLAMVATPSAAFLDLLDERGGNVVLISSEYVATSNGEWPYYVAAKCAAEGLTRAAASRFPRTSFLIVRPPRLLTDQTNTASGREGSLPTERIAVAIVRKLSGTPAPGRVEVLDEF